MRRLAVFLVVALTASVMTLYVGGAAVGAAEEVCSASHTLTIDNDSVPAPSPLFGGTSGAGPNGVAVDGSGNIHSADPSSNVVYRFNASGTQTLTITSPSTSPHFTDPDGIGVDASANIYVGNPDPNASIQMFDSSGVRQAFVLGTDPTLRFRNPRGIVVNDVAGIVYFVEAGGGVARIYSAPTNLSSATVLVDKADATPNFNAVGGIALDSAGNVYVAGNYYDTGAGIHRGIVWKFDATGTQMWAHEDPNFTVGVNGVAVDDAGNIYVSDDGSGTTEHPDGTEGVYGFRPSGDLFLTINNFSPNGPVPAFADPHFLAVDGAGETLYVSDRFSNAINVFEIDCVPKPPHADTAKTTVAIITDPQVRGGGWVPGSVVTVTADDPTNGVGTDHTDSFTVLPDTSFHSPDNIWPIEPGWGITVTDGAVTKIHMVIDITLAVDPINDVISGTAPPGDPVGVVAEHPLLGQYDEWVIADPSGDYISYSAIDLRHETNTHVFQFDNDGDRTLVHDSLFSPDDVDFDGVGNDVDNCPFVVNTGQEDADGDGVGDPCDSVHFADTNGHWAVDPIEVAYALAITNGCETDPLKFCPDAAVTRAELTAFILRVLGEDTDLPTYQGLFSDVPAGKWYTGYVEKAAQLGLVTGYVDGTFKPLKQLTRAEMAVVVMRALGEPNPPWPLTDPFDDVLKDAWYAPQVARLRDLGVVAGYGDNTYRPQNNITRAEVAAIIVRAWALSMP